MSSHSYHQLTTTITTEVMTMTDVNFNSKHFNSNQISNFDSYHTIVNSSRCVLNYSQYCEIEKLAALYESLEVLLRSFDSDENLIHAVALLGIINASFFDQLEHLSFQQNIE